MTLGLSLVPVLVLSGVVVGLGALAGYQVGRRRGAGATAPGGEQRQPERASEPPLIERALADLRLGVVVVLEDGTEAYRNRLAEQFATGRHGDALVEAALARVIDGALAGLSLEESVELYGPPVRSFLVQASPTYDAGWPSGAVGVIDDVTEARHLDRVRSDFVANVSHELRTPVGAMSVLAETIADCDDPDALARLTDRMQREATRLGDTIDDLLALSRLESGPTGEYETIDLVSVVAMAQERTAEAAGRLVVGVTVDNEAGGPLLVDGDVGQLVSAVANLIDNAVKYSDGGGEVIVRLRPADDATAELLVVDTGIGIPERDLDRIFERFYRVDGARSRDTGGTGLGLSIVRHAVLNHGGAIDVESTEGLGTTFTIRVPLSSSQAHLTAADAPTEDGPAVRGSA